MMGYYVVSFAGGYVVFEAVWFEGAEVLAVVFDEDVEFVVLVEVELTEIVAFVLFDVVVFVVVFVSIKVWFDVVLVKFVVVLA